MTKKRWSQFFGYFALISAALIAVFPIAWMAISATNTSTDILSGRMIPGTNLVNNWNNLLNSQDLFTALWNSIRNSFAGTFFNLFICSLAGYGFEIYHSKNKDLVFRIILIAMMIPFVAIMIPLYQVFGQVGLINTTAGAILPTVATPFMIMLFRQYSRAFPKDLIYAARIDGLTELGIFFRIYMPVMKSTYAAAFIVSFMSAWNNYLWPKVILQSADSFTMPMLVSNLMGGYVIDYGVVMLGVLISTIPTAVIFFVMQKSFTVGIGGAIK